MYNGDVFGTFYRQMKKYSVTGIDCPSCAAKIESELSDVGIEATCSYATCELCVATNDISTVKRILKANGCELVNKSEE